MGVAKEHMINVLYGRGYKNLNTRQGIKPLEKVPENILYGVYMSGKVNRRQKIKTTRSGQLVFNF
jgi:hypothetical protein